MKIKQTKVKVQWKKQKGLSLSKVKTLNEATLRWWIALGLKKRYKSKKSTLSISILREDLKDFSPVWAAKIITQEILKAIRHQQKDYKSITISTDDKSIYKVFKKHVFGYIHHIVENLGKGPYVTVDIIIELPKGVVLINRSNPPLGWTLPGGFVDYGESVEHAAHREAKEETNLKLKNLKQLQTYSIPSRDPRFHTISVVFTAKGVGKPKAGDDAKGLIIAPRKELLKRKYPFDHKQVIKDYLKSKGR